MPSRTLEAQHTLSFVACCFVAVSLCVVFVCLFAWCVCVCVFIAVVVCLLVILSFLSYIYTVTVIGK